MEAAKNKQFFKKRVFIHVLKTKADLLKNKVQDKLLL